jgi:hypothetical protein
VFAHRSQESITMIRRSTHLPTLALACLLAVVLTTPAAFAQQSAHIVNSQWKVLEHGNGEKMAVGRYNTLHGVYAQGGYVRYVTSADGASWTSPVIVSGQYVSGLPAVAVDSAGTVAIAFTGHYNLTTGAGRLYYAYKPLNGSWTVQEIVTDGTEPDITAYGTTVYIVFTTFDRVQYISFPTQSPPSTPVAFGEEIDVNTCPGSRFVRPSIAVHKRPCKAPVPKVAYLLENDETSNGDPLCASLFTEVGPRVCSRDDAGTWGLEWSDVLTAAQPSTGPQGASLSFNSNQRDGHYFLAWSDESDGVARTRLAHGKNGTWNAINYSSDLEHVHVQARPRDTAGRFRISVAEPGWVGFIDWMAEDQEGTWASGATPTWVDASPVLIAPFLGPAIGHPQAQWWGKCTSGSYDRIENYYEEEQACSIPHLAVDLETNLACPPSGGIIAADPCHKLQAAVSMARMADDIGVVDTSELGTLVEGGRGYAVYTQGEGGQSFELSWSGGTPSFWDGGFSAQGLSGLRVLGEKGEVEVKDDGYLAEYDEVFECRGDECGCEEREVVFKPGRL